MGVQKSRRSIRFTKYSLKLVKKFKTQSICIVLQKHKTIKSNIFVLKKMESTGYLFFNK